MLSLREERKLVFFLTCTGLFVAFCALSTGLVSSQYKNFQTPFNDPLLIGHLGLAGFYILIPYCFVRTPMELVRSVGFAIILRVIVSLSGIQTVATDFFSISNLYFVFAIFGVIAIVDVASLVYFKKRKSEFLSDFLSWGFFVLMMVGFLESMVSLTLALHPASFDTVAFHIDGLFGLQTSFVLGRIITKLPYLKISLDLIYDWLPVVGIGLFFFIRIKLRKIAPVNILTVWSLITFSALLVYHLCPIAGPAYLFGDRFPMTLPELQSIPTNAAIIAPSYRNGFPSMHLGYSLIFFLTAYVMRLRLIALLMFVAVLLTIFATLGKGEHYLIDLIAAIPYTLAIFAFCLRIDPLAESLRRKQIYTGIVLYFIWMLSVRYGWVIFSRLPVLLWGLSLVSVLYPAYLMKNLLPHAVWLEREMAQTMEPRKCAVTYPGIGWLFCISGFVGLLCIVLFTRELTLILGNVATVIYTVLAGCMLGLALGSWVGRRVTSKSKKHGLLLYAICEFGIGTFCLLSPVLFKFLQNGYTFFGAGSDPASTYLLIIRVLCGLSVLLIPTILMGMTLPVLVSSLIVSGDNARTAVARLYGANTLGAALGALLSGYFILPALGVRTSIMLCAGLSLFVGYLALRMREGRERVSSVTRTSPVTNKVPEQNIKLMVGSMVCLFLIGVVTLTLVVEYSLLLTVVVGDSSYVFSLLLFSLLVGFSSGGSIAEFLMRRQILPIKLIIGSTLGLACLLLLGAFKWDSLPEIFNAYARYPLDLSFSAREVIRGIVCCLMMSLPAAVIGVCYSVLLGLISDLASGAQKIRRLSEGLILNFIGGILGVFLGGLVLLPAIGALHAIYFTVGLCVFAASIFVVFAKAYRERVFVFGILVFAVLAIFQPKELNYQSLSSGANIYFREHATGSVIDHVESFDSGLVTVVAGKIETAEGNTPFKTLYANGKFLGNSVLGVEMRAQLGSVLIPLLHTAKRDKALVIGYNTGVSAKAIVESGFASTDIVDFSLDLITLSNQYFSNVNDKVSEHSKVNTYITDSRNFLLLNQDKYDLISVGSTSNRFSGIASFYNAEFYELARRHLQYDGVFQQLVQLHHISPLDLTYILGSVRSKFSHVSLYDLGGQGIIIGSNSAVAEEQSRAREKVLQSAGLMKMLNPVKIAIGDIPASRILNPIQIDKLLASFTVDAEFPVATEDNLYLEYAMPRGNALDAVKSTEAVHQFLAKFSDIKS